MKRIALVLLLVILASCDRMEPTKPLPPEAQFPVLPYVAKKTIPNIEQLPIDEVKRMLDECKAHGGRFDVPAVPYDAQDCSRLQSRWDRRTWGKPSDQKPAPFLPKLH